MQVLKCRRFNKMGGDVMKQELNAMTLKQLKKHSEVVKDLIETKTRAIQKLAAATEAHSVARKHGFKLSELVNVAVDPKGVRGRKMVKPVRKVAPKYQNPNDADVKWSGRGRKPLWVLSHLDDGGTMEDLRIKNS